MRKINREIQLYFSTKAQLNHKKAVKREKKKHKIILGFEKYKHDMRVTAAKNDKSYILPTVSAKESTRKKNVPKPAYSDVIKYLASKKDAFSGERRPLYENGYFQIPKIFSLTENYADSFSFLKRLFYALYFQSAKVIELDYAKCERIDVDASVCMDILLGEFILHYSRCQKVGHQLKIERIVPTNFDKEHIKKILFSIGAFSSIKGFRIDYPDVIPYPLCFSVLKNPNASKQREIHITELVDYVLKCMAKMNRTLTQDAEDNLFKVIGEVLINAEEHSSGDKRFSIGYFQDSQQNGEHVGVFNLVILNFGKTIYEKFSDPACPNQKVVEEMKELSNRYTKKGLFQRAEFEEQTLWTLYALQEGVTSKADWKRGNGSIRFIESFFSLKGDNDCDNISYLSIVSGNTRIIFDGKYRIIELHKGLKNRKFKMMTFNETGEIDSKPDKKYVRFAENYFPGTIISAKICIKNVNTEETNNG